MAGEKPNEGIPCCMASAPPVSIQALGPDGSYLGCSRTLRRGFWATLSALLSWWLVYSLRSLDVHGSEGLVFIFTAVSVSCLLVTRTRNKEFHQQWTHTELSFLLQVMAASLVEDKVQSSLFMTPFRSPEVQQLSGNLPPAQLSPKLRSAGGADWKACPLHARWEGRRGNCIWALQGHLRRRARQSCLWL